MIIEPKTWKPKDERPVRPRFRKLVQSMLRGKGTERCTWFMAGNLEGLDKREDADTAIKVVEAYTESCETRCSDDGSIPTASTDNQPRSLRFDLGGKNLAGNWGCFVCFTGPRRTPGRDLLRPTPPSTAA